MTYAEWTLQCSWRLVAGYYNTLSGMGGGTARSISNRWVTKGQEQARLPVAGRGTFMVRNDGTVYTTAATAARFPVAEGGTGREHKSSSVNSNYVKGLSLADLAHDKPPDTQNGNRCFICLSNAPICVVIPCFHLSYWCVQWARCLCFSTGGTDKRSKNKSSVPVAIAKRTNSNECIRASWFSLSFWWCSSILCSMSHSLSPVVSQ